MRFLKILRGRTAFSVRVRKDFGKGLFLFGGNEPRAREELKTA